MEEVFTQMTSLNSSHDWVFYFFNATYDIQIKAKAIDMRYLFQYRVFQLILTDFEDFGSQLKTTFRL